MPESHPEGERLQKVLAAAGVASRRVVENMIVEGRIEVNGQIVTELGTRIQPDARVSVDGRAVQLDTSKRYVMLNKPAGVVSTMRDEHGRPDLTEFTEQYEERLYNVGRLDAETRGLLLLTNDGEVAHRMAHPSFGVEKTYVALVEGRLQQRTIRALLDGFELDDGFIRADAARIKGEPRSGGAPTTQIEITLHSGRNRIVRRMLDHVGHPVLELVRRRFGPLTLGGLRSGSMRDLTSMELGQLLTLVRQDDSA